MLKAVVYIIYFYMSGRGELKVRLVLFKINSKIISEIFSIGSVTSLSAYFPDVVPVSAGAKTQRTYVFQCSMVICITKLLVPIRLNF